MPDHTLATDAKAQATPEEIVAEGVRLIGAASEAGLLLRLLGGVGIRLQCPSAAFPPLRRSYGDIDLAAGRGSGKLVRGVLESTGYTGDRRFNALHGDKRLLYLDPARRWHIDVFLGAFRMCHVLNLEERLGRDPLTLIPSDLLLTKLQIVKLNQKDVLDALALLIDHEAGTGAAELHGGIDDTYIAALCSRDWGWYTSVFDNLDRIATIGHECLPADLWERAAAGIQKLRISMAGVPKSLKWRLRDAIGRRVPWYEEPEEVQHFVTTA